MTVQDDTTGHDAPFSSAGGGGGAVESVNGQTGAVVLDAADVEALAAALPFTVEIRDGYAVVVVAVPEGWPGGKATPALAFGLPDEDHARLLLMPDGTFRLSAHVDTDPALYASNAPGLYPNNVGSADGLGLDGTFQAYGGLYDENGVKVPSASSVLPIADPAGMVIDTTTYDNTITGSGKIATMVFPTDTPVAAWAVAGDAFPRGVIGADPTDDGLFFLGDGTYDPVFQGAGVALSSVGVLQFFANQAGLTDTFGDIRVRPPGVGVILPSPDGTRHRLRVADDGTLSTEVVA